jgi:hypothetical protein
MLEMPEIRFYFLLLSFGAICLVILVSPGCLVQLLRVVCRNSLRVGARGKRELLMK